MKTQNLFSDKFGETTKKEPDARDYEQKLSKTAKNAFNRVKREYGITDPAGLLLLKAAFEAFDECRAAQKEMQGQPIYRDRFGQPQENPAAKVIRASRTQMINALKALNLDIEPPEA